MNNDRLKFRLWDIKNEEYVEDQCDECCISFDGRLHAGAYCDDGYTGHWGEYEQHEVIIEQCTGLRDKNGNLMYAGDRGVRNDCFVKNQEFVILWDDANARFIAKTKDGILDFIPDGDCAEIIGNIHEQKDGE